MIPGHSGGSGSYVIGVVVLAALVVGLVLWKRSSTPPPQTTPQATTTTATAEPPPMINAPPPPPKVDEPADAGPDAAPAATAGTGAVGKSPCAGKCGDGRASSGLQSALSSAAQSARGCYQRALRTSEVSGSLTVSVQVGPNGQVCGASITNDSVGSSEIASCVLGRFRGRTFPAPETGCVVVNIPITFTIKQ
jgi:outer membrane biosynthesis protein TonB